MAMQKVELTEPKHIEGFQELIDKAYFIFHNGHDSMLWPRKLTVNKVEWVRDSPLKEKYLSCKERIVSEIDSNGTKLPLLEGVPSQEVNVHEIVGTDERLVEKEYNEFYLFHGTSPENVDKILAGDFRASTFNRGAAFGDGVYLAEYATHAAYFAKYSEPYKRRPDGTQILTIFLCR